MRRWYKYFINHEDGRRDIPKDANFADHKSAMQGYAPGEAYRSKESFFKAYLHSAHPRHGYYNEYVKDRIKKGADILSIGSGRCANELFLIEDGFSITCSDLEQPCRAETMRLFPKLRFMEYDVTKAPAGRRFDSVISLSMCYLFDEKELSQVFKNVANSLTESGTFILDPCGAEDGIGTRLIDDLICPAEMSLVCLINNFFRRKKCVVARKHQGYRSTDKDIISIAEKSGFVLCDIKKYDYFTELGMRSMLFGRLPKIFVKLLGRAVPYVRLFVFKKDERSAVCQK